MRYVEGEEKTVFMQHLQSAALVARESSCIDARCGSIITNSNEIIGKGFNSPPNNLQSQRRCSNSKDDYDKKVTDKTCCVHAEQRAIVDALRKNSDKIANSTLYFMRVDNDGKILPAGKPYCTICSKMALDVGIKYFVLLHKEGIAIYSAEEYNDFSFSYSP